MIQMEFYCFICYYAISLLLLLFYMRGFVQERDVDAVRERERVLIDRSEPFRQRPPTNSTLHDRFRHASPLSITVGAAEIVGIRRAIRFCAEVLLALRQGHQAAVPVAIQGSRKGFDVLCQNAGIPGLYVVLWARVRPVTRACWVGCWTLAKRLRRVAPGSVGGEVGNGIVEVGDAVVAGVVGPTLVGGAVDQIGRCVIADAWLTIGILFAG